MACREQPGRDGRTCSECMSIDHSGSGQAFLMCVNSGYDCRCNTPNASLSHPRLLQRGLRRAAWKNGDDAHRAYIRLLSHRPYLPTALRPPPEPHLGTGSWIVQYDNFTTPEEARALIHEAGAAGWAPGSGGATASQRASRTNAVAWCHAKCAANPLVERVIRKIEQVTGIGRMHYETLQLLKYLPGEFFRRHHDSYDGAFGGQEQGHRILTAFMYLSGGDVEGGETAFTDLPGQPAVAPRLGRMIVWPNVWTAEPTTHDHRMMHEARAVTKGVKYGANVWLRLYPRGHDPRYPLPPLCDMYPHVPECAHDVLSGRRRDRAKESKRRKKHGGARHSIGRINMTLAMLPYTCTRNRDFPASCIRGGGIGCPFREISSLLQCRALCDEYEGQCFTLTHNRYGECYLRAAYAGAGVLDLAKHWTVSCRRL